MPAAVFELVTVTLAVVTPGLIVVCPDEATKLRPELSVTGHICNAESLNPTICAMAPGELAVDPFAFTEVMTNPDGPNVTVLVAFVNPVAETVSVAVPLDATPST